MKLEIDIEGMVAAAVQANLATEKLQPIIEANVGKAIKEAIESQFSYRSPFKEALEAALKERMPATVADMGRYGDFVMKAVVTQLNALQMDVATNAVTPMLERITKPLPSEMTITELLKEVFDDFNSDHEIYRESNEQPTFIIKQPYPDCSVLGKHMTVYIDPEENKPARNCKFALHFGSDGKCNEVKFDDASVKENLIIGSRSYGIERLLLQLYTQQITVTFDQTDFFGVFNYGEPNDY